MTVVEDKQKLARREDEQRHLASLASHESTSEEALITDGFVVPDLEVPSEAPPAYGDHLDQMQFSQPGFEAGAAVTADGRVNININTKNSRLSQLLAPSIARQAAAAAAEQQEPLPPAYIPPSLGGLPDQTPPPRLNVVIQIVGSRGDVQPFVALGKTLKETYGHRIRIATHPTFQKFVEENDLEFFSIGGDPAELMAFMVKHPGLMPGFDAVKSGEITKRRKGVEEMLMGCWRSCIEAGDGMGPPPRPHAENEPLDVSHDVAGDPSKPPFVADAIIANPPSFAHIHIAEKLGIPLHMMFTMPWTPTRAFQHPLANIQSTNADAVLTNYLSYTLVEMMTWQGLGDIINRFREKALNLSPLSLLWAPGLLTRLKISYTYCWSPALIPKPKDWGRNIDIPGFFFLDLATSYTPDAELDAFLKAGPPPVYIGFGSIVVDDPNAMTRMIFDAVHLAGCRALVSKGWGGLGADDVGLPEGVFMLGNVPHDWLFKRVSCVVHHGGAGTTAAGIKAGKPTFVVPFFGDQPFWGSMISRAKAGPDPVPYQQLTAEKLAEAIKFCLQPDTLEQAGVLGAKIREEKGTDVGGQSFHNHLDIESLRCSVAPSRAAAWRVRRTKVRLSPFVATVLVNKGYLKYSDLKLYQPAEYDTYDQPTDPISAGAASIVVDLGTIGMAIADMPRDIWKSRMKLKENKTNKSKGDAESGLKPTDTASQLSQDTADVSNLRSTETNLSQQSLSQHSLSQVSTPGTPTESQVQATETQASGSSSQAQAGPSQSKEAPAGGFGMDAAVDTARGVNRVVTTGVKSPMNFCLGLARGFRNVPKLYNDDTVRSADKVTDLQSGIKVAGKELGYGFFDGLSGLVTQPLRGAEKDGAAGLVKGFGKGIGGLIMKPAAGIWGLPAYTMQGVHAELNKLFSRSVHNYIISSRVRQGEIDEQDATPEECEDILKHWNNIKFDLAGFYQLKRKGKAAEKAPADGGPGPEDDASSDKGFTKPRTNWFKTRHLAQDQRKKMQEEKKSWKRGYVEAQVPQSGSGASTPASLDATEESEIERAIQASVRETSRGNVEEDAMIEVAIRESVNAMRDRGDLPSTGAGAVSDEKSKMDKTIFEDEDYQITDEEYQQLVEQAISKSMYGGGSQSQLETGVVGADSATAVDQRPQTQQSDGLYEGGGNRQQQPASPPGYSAATQEQPPPVEEDDEELQRAIAASKEDSERVSAQRTEEEVVMDYVMKQSMAEEEFRKTSAKGKGAEQPEEEDEDLKRAMEESLKLSGGGEDGASGSKN